MKRIGIDTNILLRLIVDDDEEQHKMVRAFGAKLNKDYMGVITLLGILELDWHCAASMAIRGSKAAWRCPS